MYSRYPCHPQFLVDLWGMDLELTGCQRPYGPVTPYWPDPPIEGSDTLWCATRLGASSKPTGLPWWDSRDSTQDLDTIPALFPDRLTEALIKYTKQDQGSLLVTHFISQSPDIQAQAGPQTSWELIKMTFSIYNIHEKMSKPVRQAHLLKKVSLQSQALVSTLHLAVPRGVQALQGACFKCEQQRYWSPQCQVLSPHKLTKSCPCCRQMIHLKLGSPMWGSLYLPL